MQTDWNFLFTFFIYSLRAIMSLFWGITLLFMSKRSYQNLPFGIIFFLVGLVYLRNGFVRLPILGAYDVYNPSSYVILILIAPLTIFYTYFVFGERHTLKHKLLHFIPFGLIALLWGALELSGTPRVPVSYSLNKLLVHLSDYPLHVGFYLLLISVFIAQVLCYFTMALRRLLHVRKIYRKHGLSLRPVTLLTVMDFLFLIYPLMCVFFMSYYNDLNFGLVFNIFVPVVITVISVINLLLVLPLKTDLGFMDNPEQRITSDYTSIIDREKVEANSLMFERIKALFEEKEIYRLPHLTLQDLVMEMDTNRTYLSGCINSYYGCNFKQLVCRYRIEAAKELMLHTDLDIQNIINKVGFNSRSSFYNAFHENVCNDLSPSEWRLNAKSAELLS